MPSSISSIRESSIELFLEILTKSLWLFSDSLSDSESSDLISRLSSNLLSLSISKSLIKIISSFKLFSSIIWEPFLVIFLKSPIYSR